MIARWLVARPGVLSADCAVDDLEGGERIRAAGEAALPPGTVIRGFLRHGADLIGIRETFLEDGRFEIDFDAFDRPLFPGSYRLRIEFEHRSTPALDVPVAIRTGERAAKILAEREELACLVEALRSVAGLTRLDLDRPWLGAPFREARWLLTDLAASARGDPAAAEETLDSIAVMLWDEALEDLPAATALAREIAAEGMEWLPRARPGSSAEEADRSGWLLARQLPDHLAAFEAARLEPDRWMEASRPWLLALLSDHLTVRRLGWHPALADVQVGLAELASMWIDECARIETPEHAPSSQRSALVAARLESSAQAHGGLDRLGALLARELASARRTLQSPPSRSTMPWSALAWACHERVARTAPAEARRLVAALSQALARSGNAPLPRRPALMRAGC